MTSRKAQRAQERGWQRVRKPFARLVRHSIERVMHGGHESGELDFGIGAMLALFAVPGAFASFAASPTDEYFLSCWQWSQPAQ